MSSDTSDVLLRRHGMRVTPQRLAVMRAVADRQHSTADDVYTVVRAEIGAISRQTVYDALDTLTRKGLFRRVQPAGSSARYESRVGDHHHLVCRACGRMADVDRAVGDTSCLSAPDGSGYHGIDGAEVIYWGRCRECAATAGPGAVSHRGATAQEEDHRRA